VNPTEAHARYRQQWLYIKFIGTHAQYDKVDAATVDQSLQ
jgi:mRNA interferase HigB